MQAYVGIDLHSTNSYIGIIDQEDKRLFQKRFLPEKWYRLIITKTKFLQKMATKG